MIIKSAATSLKIGLLINPYSGLGGSVGLKGSDGKDIVAKALSLGAQPKAMQRVKITLQQLQGFKQNLEFYCYAGDMGATLLGELGFEYRCIGAYEGDSTAKDTQTAVTRFISSQVDIILFAGGDGTARDICAVVDEQQLVLGIPCGVKIQSAVYAVNPAAAGEVLLEMLVGHMVNACLAQVRDIDEVAFRDDRVQSRYYGEMLVPQVRLLVQQVKTGASQDESLLLDDIADYVVDEMLSDTLYIVGPGTTTRAVMLALDLDNTLLGVDLVAAGELIDKDVNEQALLEIIQRWSGPVCILVTAIGGQGHVFGRGNPQISAAVLKKVGKKHIQIIMTTNKLRALDDRPMLVDTGELDIDQYLCGWYSIITGYNDSVLYRVAS